VVYVTYKSVKKVSVKGITGFRNDLLVEVGFLVSRELFQELGYFDGAG